MIVLGFEVDEFCLVYMQCLDMKRESESANAYERRASLDEAIYPIIVSAMLRIFVQFVIEVDQPNHPSGPRTNS